MQTFIFLAIAIGSISTALTKSTIAEYIQEFTQSKFSKFPIITKLFKCHFCMNHWVSLFFLFFVTQNFVVNTSSTIITYLANYFVLVGLSTLASALINYFLIQPDAQIEYYMDKLDSAKKLIAKLSNKS